VPAVAKRAAKTAEQKGKKGKKGKKGRAKGPAKPKVPLPMLRAGVSKPDRLRQWTSYRNAARIAIGKLPKGNTFKKALALSVLAPGRKYDVSWGTTLGAGKIKQVDIFRNYRRPAPKELEGTKLEGEELQGEKIQGEKLQGEEPLLTMQRALDKLGYRIVEAGSPTNPKEHGRGENKMQLADLFLVNEYWKTTRSGIVTPGTAEIKPVDDSALSATKTYWKISDHSPVLMLGSTKEYDVPLHRAFQMASAAGKKAVQANMAAWENVDKLFGGLQALPGIPPVTQQVAEIKKLLSQPLAGPRKDVLDELSKRTVQLKQTIDGVSGFEPSPVQATVLRQLAEWQPFFTTDVGEEAETGDPSAPQSQPAQPDEMELDKGTAKEPEKDPAEKRKQTWSTLDLGTDWMAELLDPTAVVQANWPTGEIVHVSNSCYLAALIHVLASDQAFTNLLHPGTHLPLRAQGLKFQAESGLHALVNKLQDSQATISMTEMRTFMTYLDGLGDVLVPEPLTEQEKEQQKKAQAKKAGQKAKQATETRKAFGVQQDAAEILGKVLDRLEPSAAVVSSIESKLTPPTDPGGPRNIEGHPVLNLPIDNPAITSISGALRAYSAPSQVTAGYPALARAKTLQFAALPGVLTIALSRFRPGVDGTPTKIRRMIFADDPLTIPASCLTRELRETLGGQEVRYQLIHFVSHSGETASSGHYRSFGRLPQSGEWYRHDDTNYPYRRTVPGFAARLSAMHTGYIYVYRRIP
jgi:hypothetical protein